MKRLACVAGILFLAGTPAFACPSPLTGKDAAGTTQNFGVTLDGSANCYGNIAIVDGSNAANKATVTAGNALKVDGSAVTQPVSGTVTSNQGGAPWSVSQSGNWTARVVGNAGGIFDFAGQNAAQPANSILIGGEFNTTPTTLVSPAASPLQLDSSGNLLVNLKANSFGTLTVTGTVTSNQGTSPWVENVTQFASSAVQTGTGASGAGIPRVTVANDSNILATQSGTWTVQQGGAPWSVSQSGNWTTRIVGNAGGVVDAAGQNAVAPANELLVAGQFNTSPTTITSGNISPFQLDANGNLLVNVKVGGGTGGTSSNFAAAFPSVGTAIGAKNGANMVNLTADGSSNLNVNCMVGCGASGFSDLSAFTLGTSNINNIGGVYEVTPAPVANGQAAAVMITGNRAALINHRDSAGREIGGNLPGANNVPVQVAIPPALGAVVNQAIAPIDALGQPRSAAMLTDGTHYASVMPAGIVPSGLQSALVVAISPNTPAVAVTQSTTPWTVSGTITANQGGAPWQENVTQFGSTNISTGTGASGAGIPRVTVANDSNVLATQSGTWTVQQGGSPWSVTSNLTQVAGTSVSTAAAGTQKVGIVGNTGAAMDAAGQNAGSPTNELIVGCQFNSSPTGITSGNVSPVQCNTNGSIKVDGSAVVQPVSGTITANEGGTWTVQPGNTQNTTPWLTSIVGAGNTASVNASNQLAVNCANCSGSGVSQQDLTGFVFGSGNMAPIGGVYSSTPSPIPSGQAAAVRLTANRAVQHTAVNSAAQEIGASLPGANNIAVQVNQIATIAPPSSLLPVRSAITDGQHVASVNPGLRAPAASDASLVVALSPLPSLQCPYTVGINQTASTQIVTGQAGRRLHVCTFGFVSASAQNVSLVEGTGATCGTGTAALVGGTSASVAAAANGGLWNTSAQITIPMQNNGDNLCVLQSAAGNVSGTLTYGVF